jgi:hypothetical protein
LSFSHNGGFLIWIGLARGGNLPIPSATDIDLTMFSYIPGREEGDEDPEYGDGVG